MRIIKSDFIELVKYACIAFAVTLVIYLPSARFDFVDYDDTDYIMKNEHLRDGLTMDNVKWAFTSRGVGDNWHPLNWMSMMADVTVLRMTGRSLTQEEWLDYGNRLSRVMHAHNVLLHAADAALLFLLTAFVLRCRLSLVWPLGLALVWALHPLRTEVVCWASERKELLSVFFMLLSVWAWIARGRVSGWASAGCYAASLVFAVLAMLSKPVAVTLPAILFAWDWIYVRRMRIIGILPFVAMSALTCIFTMQSQTEAISNGSSMGVNAKITMAFVSPLIYLRQTFWPVDLSFAYFVREDVDWFAVGVGVALVLSVAGLCLFWLWRRCTRREIDSCADWLDLAVFGIAWVYVGLVPMLGIVKVGGQLHSDRYTYWVSCGACVVIAQFAVLALPKVRGLVNRISADTADEEWLRFRKMCLFILIGVAGALGCATYQRIGCWRNSIVLFRDALPKSWNDDVAHNLAEQLAKLGPQGKNEAEHWLRTCLNENPNVETLLNLAQFILVHRPENQYVSEFGGELFAEADLLIKQALSASPDSKRALELKKVLQKIREEAKQDVQR